MTDLMTSMSMPRVPPPPSDRAEEAMLTEAEMRERGNG